MKTITKTEHCSECRECCKFTEDEKEYGILMTSDEMKKIKQRVQDVKIINHNGSENVFKADLIKSKTEKGIYVCPYLVEESHECKIYDIVPFECKLWPFEIIKSDENSCVNLMCYEKKYCPSLQKISEKEFEEYKEYLIKLLTSDEYKAMIKRHPELAGPDEDDAFFVEKIKIE
jgi:Fe-S-cluster containining protein